MKAIPRLVAGTAVVLAAVLTTAPVTAGIADFVLNPGQQPIKRAAPALTGPRTPPSSPAGTREEDRDEDPDVSSSNETKPDVGTDSATTAAFSATVEQSSTNAQSSTSAQPSPNAQSTLGETAGLVARTAADAQSRVADLASDLQSGVAAGEFSQADADRVVGELSSYIKGERTWPERAVA